jgi:glycosyltransferase involved in cell wall biosynthesis
MPVHPILVVIPALNEARSLPKVLAELKQLDYPILVVDDGSTDDTFEVVQSHEVTVLRLPINLGVGGALRAGFRFAVDHGYSAVVQLDADGQHPINQIGELINAAEQHNAHLVIGSRYRSENATLSPNMVRRLPMRVMSFLISRSSGVKITDATSGFRIVREPLLSEFAKEFPVYYLGDTYEATLSAARSGYRLHEIPAALRNREYGESSASTFRAVALIAKVLITTIFRLGPGVDPLLE